MFKNLLIMICMCLPFISFGQSKALVDSINKVIGPWYHLGIDSAMKYYNYNSFDEVDLTGDDKKEIVVAAAKINTEKGTDSNKIFVLERNDKRLKIIDSSADYERDGRGPSVRADGQNLIITHSFHHGSNTLTYHFNGAAKAYILDESQSFEAEPNNPDTLHVLYMTQTFSVSKQLLELHTSINNYKNDKVDKEKTRQVSSKLPADAILLLRDMKNPSSYDDAFLYEGRAYDEMMKY